MGTKTKRSCTGLIGPLVAFAMLGAGGPQETPRTPRPDGPARPTRGADSLPQALPDEALGSRSPEMSLPAQSVVGTPLVEGQVIQPIDLPGALRLGGAADLDIAIARERVAQSLAELQQARVQWLPSLYIGPNWIRHDGWK